MGVKIGGYLACDGCRAYAAVSLTQYERCGKKVYCDRCYQKWLHGEAITWIDKVYRIADRTRKKKQVK